MRPLGTNQIGLLDALTRYGYWYRGCGWTWGGDSNTARVMDTLVKRKLVKTRNRSDDITVYVPA